MICPQCGIEISDNSNFCTHCGAPLHSTGTPDLAGAPFSYKLNFEKLLRDTFELYKRNFGTMCLVGLIMFIVPLVVIPFNIITSAMQGWAQATDNAPLLIAAAVGDVLISILQTLLQWYVMLGIIRQCLYTVRGGTGIRINLICPPFMTYLKFVGIVLVLGCIQFGIMLPVAIPIFIGVAMMGFSQNTADPLATTMIIVGCCISIPCFCVWLWITIRLHLAQLFLADQDLGIADSIMCGWRASSGNFWLLLISGFVFAICAMLGLFFCCVGIFMTFAIGWLGSTLAYLQLTGQPNCLDYPHS